MKNLTIEIIYTRGNKTDEQFNDEIANRVGAFMGGLDIEGEGQIIQELIIDSFANGKASYRIDSYGDENIENDDEFINAIHSAVAELGEWDEESIFEVLTHEEKCNSVIYYKVKFYKTPSMAECIALYKPVYKYEYKPNGLYLLTDVNYMTNEVFIPYNSFGTVSFEAYEVKR